MTCRAIIEVDERGRPTLLETEVHHLVYCPESSCS